MPLLRPRFPAPPTTGLPREFLAVLALVAGAACSSDDDPLAPAASPVPRLAAFTWQTATPGSQGLDAAKLDALRKGAAGTKIFLVVRNDRIVHEWYASGWTAADGHHTASLAKSLVGGTTLILALGDGRLSDGDAASRYVTAWESVSSKAGITIRQLASHSSGLADADEGDGGWEDDFWNWNPDPFTVAIRRAPVVAAPGSAFVYSNPAFAVLAYAVTASLRNAPISDLRTLLERRVLDPIGVGGSDWRVGYNRSPTVDGMTVVATHGGANFTGRAAARVARLMLRRGDWEGTPLLDPTWVDRALRAASPTPARGSDDAYPRAGLTWYTNEDAVWAALPSDAFAGAGNGHQIVLVVPSWNLILVRFGSSLGTPFWESAERVLFSPLAGAVVGSSAPPPPPPPPPNEPPSADFSWTCHDLTCELTDRSTDADGTITERSWDLGGGSSSGETVVTHTFAEGSSTVSLTVTDDDGASDTASRSLIVPIPNQPPFAAFDVTCVHLACEFRDASTDSDGVVADHSWDFGDGSGSAATNPSHAYDAEGTYHVTLTVTDDAGDVNAASTTLAVAPNAPPVAEFDVSCAGRRCTFTDRSSDPDGGIAARSWESGDGAVSSQSEFVHTYGADGAYTATLRVADAAGLEDAASREVLVANAPPEASFSWSCANLACQFTDASSDAEGDLAARAWDFGDGGTSQAADPAHSYAGAGDYVVTLTVRDGDGAEDAEVRTLTVSAPPVFTLSARGYRVRRKHRVDLTWSGARTPTVDMYRNGARKGSGWVNDGFQTDRMSATGKATYDYRICEAGTQVCSNTVRVVF